MLVPIVRSYLSKNTISKVIEVLNSGQWCEGNYTRKLEQEFAKYINVKYCRAVSNGTTALMAIIHSLGFKKGAEVLVPDFSFIASANCVFISGAKPVFIDIDEKTYNIDVHKAKKKITKNTKAIICVHLYGLPCEMDELLELSEKYGIYLIEDCAQAHGAMYKNKKVGCFGIANAFSLYPTKNMVCGGEGGLVTTNDENLYEKICTFVNQGQKEKYYHTTLGYNFRIDEVKSVIALDSLKQLDKNNAKRIKNAAFYNNYFEKTNKIITPYKSEYCIHVYHQYTIRIKNRNKLVEKLKANCIGYGIHYPKPLHEQEFYSSRSYSDLEIATKVAKEVLSLPVHPYLKEKELNYVAEIVTKYV